MPRSQMLFTAVLKAYDINHDFHEGVWLCAVAFVLAGLFALFVNAEQPVVAEPVREKCGGE